MVRCLTHRLEQTPWWVLMLAVGLITGVMGGVVGYLHPPVPAVHDEFAYLLAGDTFAHGRVTNPTHPHWESFESFHIIHQPSYASKYPPGQGLFLALGQVLFGDPFAGVCISMGLAAAACYWMLLGWAPKRWANLGGLLLMLHPSFQLNWGQSFWGGGVATLGGALLLGATVRLVRQPRFSAAVTMALGALVLANSRPYEGAVAWLACGVWVLAIWVRRSWIRHGWPTSRTVWLQVVAPQAVVLTAGAALMLGYNYQVTGDPLKMPYVVHEAEYGLAPLFLWQPPVADHDYRHPRVAKYHHGWSMDSFREQQTPGGLLHTKGEVTLLALGFFFPLPVAAVLLLTPWLRGRRMRPALVLLGVGWGASMISVWGWPHYMAPLVAPLALLLVVWGLRNLIVFGRRWNLGALPAYVLVGLQAVIFFNSAITHVNTESASWEQSKAEITALLTEAPKKDLVFVRYAPDYEEFAEWVYNEADIDNAEVVWARERDPEHDRELVEYFKDRVVWVLEADNDDPRLTIVEPGKGKSELARLGAK